MSNLKFVEEVSSNQHVIDVIEDINGNNIYVVVDECEFLAFKDLEILEDNYPLHGCESCNYTADRASADYCKYGNFRCQNCGNFKEFLFEVEE